MSTSPRAAAVALTLAAASVARAQDCPGLAALEPPKLEKCGGGLFRSIGHIMGVGCEATNDRLKEKYERMSRGFTTGLKYDSNKLLFADMNDSVRMETVDELRGCRGETVNIMITPGNVKYFEYQLTSPSGVILAQHQYSTWVGDQIMGPALTLPESGTYKLVTRTSALPVTGTRKNKRGNVEYVTSYPRHFAVSFRSDASVAPISVGDKIDGSATAAQPFIRRVSVKGGSKVRLRLASQGTGPFSYAVLRESGEELARGANTNFADVPAVSPAADETFRVEARPALPDGTVGVQLMVLDDKAGGATVTNTSRVQSAFKLPAQFDSDNNPAHKSVYATETARLTYKAGGPERVTMNVRPSGASGLVMRVRVYDEATEDVVLDQKVAKPTAVPVALPRAGTYVIALSPLSASEMAQAGEAKYTVEFAPGGATRPARTR